MGDRSATMALRGILAASLCPLVVVGIATPPAFDARATSEVVAALILAGALILV